MGFVHQKKTVILKDRGSGVEILCGDDPEIFQFPADLQLFFGEEVTVDDDRFSVMGQGFRNIIDQECFAGSRFTRNVKKRMLPRVFRALQDLFFYLFLGLGQEIFSVDKLLRRCQRRYQIFCRTEKPVDRVQIMFGMAFDGFQDFLYRDGFQFSGQCQFITGHGTGLHSVKIEADSEMRQIIPVF